jgi:uncharacterized ion transporter superfamily protein YfcC
MTEIQEAPPDRVEEPKERRPLRFPTAFTVLAAVLLVVWGLSFVIPSGTYDVDADTGGPIPGTYTEIDIDKSLPHQFYKLWNAPTNGLYGIVNDAGNVSVDNSGFLYGSAQIFLFVLAIGAFISVTMKTGAIQSGIGRLALRFRHSPAVLIVVLMSVFALGGTTEGMWEETLGFSRCSSRSRSRSASTASPAPRSSSSAPARACSRRPSTRSPPASRPMPPASASAKGSACGS